MNYIHYGHNNFDITKFDKIANIPAFTKPFGGLWGCRVDSENDWKKCCEELELKRNVDEYFIFSLKESSKILTIDRCEKLLDLPRAKDGINLTIYTVLDFEELSKEYDAIEILISEDGYLYRELYGWDCDSILVMNPHVVIQEK